MLYSDHYRGMSPTALSLLHHSGISSSLSSSLPLSPPDSAPGLHAAAAAAVAAAAVSASSGGYSTPTLPHSSLTPTLTGGGSIFQFPSSSPPAAAAAAAHAFSFPFSHAQAHAIAAAAGLKSPEGSFFFIARVMIRKKVNHLHFSLRVGIFWVQRLSQS